MRRLLTSIERRALKEATGCTSGCRLTVRGIPSEDGFTDLSGLHNLKAFSIEGEPPMILRILAEWWAEDHRKMQTNGC